MLDHVIVLNEKHLRRLIREYVARYNEERTHYSLGKDAPCPRAFKNAPSPEAEIVSVSRLGDRHHRYEWRQVA